MDFHSLYAHGFARVAACTMRTSLADPAANGREVLAVARQCHTRGVALAVLPELALSGYSIEDLLLQDALLDAVLRAVATVLEGSKDLLPVLLVGAPLRHRGRVFNTALVIHRGRLLGVVPKSYLPTYREFYERRQIAPGDDTSGDITLAGQTVPFGPDLLFAAEDVPGFVLHVEICEDMWVPIPPSAEAALAGATVLANLSGSPITIGRADTRRLLCQSASARCRSLRPPASPRRRRWRWPTSTSTCCGRSACAWAPSTTTAAPTRPAASGSAKSPSASIHRLAISAWSAAWSGSPSCRPTPRASNWIATRPTTSRSRASCSGCAPPA